MGWTSFYDPNKTPVMDLLRQEFREASIVDHSVRGNVVYLAVKEKDGEDIFGCVVLTGRRDGDFYYKVVSESMGPFEYDCPKRILDKLSPTSSEYANEWRTKCRETAAAKRAVPKLKQGDVVEFDTPIAFTGGDVLSRFIYESGSVFLGDDGYSRYRVTNWRKRPFTVVGALAAA